MSRLVISALCWVVVSNLAVAQRETPNEVVVGARFVEYLITARNPDEVSRFKLARVRLEDESLERLPKVFDEVHRFAQQYKLDEEVLACEQEMLVRDQGNQKILYRLADEIGQIMFLKVHILHKASPPTITGLEVVTPKEATCQLRAFTIPIKLDPQ